MSISTSPIQEVAGKTTSGGSATKDITISTPGAGNSLRLLITSQNNITISSVTGGGVTWALTQEYHAAPNNTNIWIYEGDNSSGSGTTVGVTISNTYATVNYNVTEWSGVDPTPVADPAGTTNNGTSATSTTASATPTAGKNVLLLAVSHCPGPTTTNAPSGWTALSRDASATDTGYGYLVVASASGSYSTTFGLSASYYPWGNIIEGWDGASGGGGVVVGRGLND